MPKKNLIFLAALIIYAIIWRVSRIMPNVAPVAAVAIWSGANLRRPWSLMVPVVTMLMSDIFIGFYEWPIMLAVYGSFVLTAIFGKWLWISASPWKIISLSLGSSSLFFLITNWAVWQFSGMYPPTLAGLIQSYYFAIPFYRNTLLGDLSQTGAIFLAWQYLPQLFFSLVGIWQRLVASGRKVTHIDG